MRKLGVYIFFLSTLSSLIVKSVYVFQTDDYYPLSRCTYGVYGRNNFKGIELEIVRETMEKVGWKEDRDFIFECKKYTLMLDQVLINDTVSGAFGAIPIQTSKMEKGLRFSQQTMENGVSVIAKDDDQTFYFLNVMEWKAACVTIFITPLVFALGTYYYEGQTVKATSYLFQYLCAFFFLSNNIKINEIGSRLLQKFYWLSILIFISLYTARLITETTKIKLGGVQNEGDIENKNVLILNAYADVISNLKANASVFDEDQGTEDIERIFRADKSIRYLATDDIVLEYLVYRECDFYFVNALQKLTTFKFAMVFGKSLGGALENAINKAILDVVKNKTFNQRINEFFKKERIPSCPKTTMRYRDSYNLQDTKELGLIYFCVVCLAMAVSVGIFCYAKKGGKILDIGSKQIDLREKKNKELVDGVLLLMTAYCKANEVKINDNLLGRLNKNKRMIFEMLKQKNRRVTENQEESIWEGIMKTSSDEFRKYIEGNASLHDILTSTKPGRQSNQFARRASKKVFPLSSILEEGGEDSSAKVLISKSQENSSPLHKTQESPSPSPRNRPKLSFTQRLSFHIHLAFVKQVDVPVPVKLRVKEYLENMHLKKKERDMSWFKKATQKAMTIFNFRTRGQTLSSNTKIESTRSFKFEVPPQDEAMANESDETLKSKKTAALLE